MVARRQGEGERKHLHQLCEQMAAVEVQQEDARLLCEDVCDAAWQVGWVVTSVRMGLSCAPREWYRHGREPWYRWIGQGLVQGDGAIRPKFAILYYVATDSEEVLSEEAWGHFASMLSPLPDVRKLQLEALKKPYIDANDNRDHAGFLGTIAGLNATLQGEMRRAWKVNLLKQQQRVLLKGHRGPKVSCEV